MLNSLKRKFIILMMIFMPLSFTSCEDSSDVITTIIELLLSMLGWNPDSENIDNQEKGDTYDETDGSLPSKVDLSSYFPPIGNQGSYGTCVAWSTGYALKTALDAKTNNYSASQLKNSSYQCSPIDLWHNIPTSGKSTSCNGSNFEPALEAMMSNGVASMSQVPFTNSKMVCDGVTGQGGSNKLKGYRVIAYTSDLKSDGPYGMNVTNIKHYLAAGFPILIGARLGENFMEWSGSGVLSSDTEDYNGQHAYHAMVVTGYDDSKGAFRIRNSWGESDWGDNGCIWIGYDFFINQFIFGAWIAYNSDQEPSLSSSYKVSLKAGDANDLATHVYSDVENADGTRTLTYDIENAGSSSIPSNGWSVIYMLYNAKNLNEKAILFQDFYGSNEDEDYGLVSFKDEVQTNSVEIEPGKTAGETLGGKRMSFRYRLPSEINGNALNGKYYMVLIVNPFNTFSENSFENNYSFVAANGKTPLIIENGKIQNMPSSLSDVRSLVTKDNMNTYEGDDLVSMLLHQKENNKLKSLTRQDGNATQIAVKNIVK